MTTMKGLLKGLRYISQIFDNEKEEEMEIGYPTDVKHVAHIGMEGPSANTPTWMNEFKSNSEMSSNGEPNDKTASKPPTQDPIGVQKSSRASMNSPTRDLPMDSPTCRSSSKTKQSRRHHRRSSSGSVGSPTRDSLGPTKTRRHKNSGDLDSPTGGSSNQARRLHLGSESPTQDQPGVPKHTRRKKSKGSSSGGTSRSSRSKGPDPLTENFPYSDPGSGHGSKNENYEMHPNSVFKVYEEGNECDDLSRRIRAL
ncbi:CRIB domain-containing protein RIC10-like [Actinidia eriantha]|uniref:CRIB domain-containing protein RIC10-like n=1 Tax=Actinidia eriantha TaxID=165200 RepID=UPI0025874CDB|nr:CRIB domain-containing protein RIC10-like [Actinidia eriantha]XP_057477898.1 CRIB domain-containing protein RIC10-like [Actinidia eriantha]